MGVIALGIGFGTPLALAGVAVHVAAHAVAKALGFYAATPLLGHEPRAAGHAVDRDRRARSPRSATSLGISLGALAGLPPSPLFVSEVLIVAGGFQAGHGRGRRGAAASCSRSASSGLAHALIETTRRASPARRAGAARRACARSSRRSRRPSSCCSALAAAALWLPGSDLVDALARGLA